MFQVLTDFSGGENLAGDPAGVLMRGGVGVLLLEARKGGVGVLLLEARKGGVLLLEARKGGVGVLLKV